jgi:hypothetical protein
MTIQIFESPQRLAGRAVFLSAAPPANPDARLVDTFEEAVLSCARAVLSEGGRLVFGGHPEVSPLVAMIAGEYVRRAGEPLIDIYQAEPFRGFLPDETLRLFRLGHAKIHWTPRMYGEAFNPKGPRPFCPDSLDEMRKRMIGETRPVAMIAIAGREGITREFETFRELRPEAPVFLLPRTGGHTRELFEKSVNAIDAEEGIHLPFDPPSFYPIVLQKVVERIAEEGAANA